MKELISAQEKAEAYDKAIEIIRKCETDKYGCIIGIKPSDIFSELKDSKNEGITQVIRGWIYTQPASFFDNGISKEEILDWIEKQGDINKRIQEEIEKQTKQQWKSENEGEQIDLVNKEYWRGYREGKQEILDKYSELEKQGEQNPYSGVSFKYNGHTWGMCARDNGVEILIDGHLKGRVFTNDSNAKEMFIKALERVEEQNNKGYKLTDCDKISWWEDFKAYTSCTIVQKPADNVKPKFKVGDWVIGRATHNEPRQIAEVTKEGYKTAYGGWYGFSWGEDMHLWTIEDAKDGDILSWDDSKCIALFKNIYDDVSFNSYGFVGHCTGTFESRPTFHDIDGAHPASKEQRDQLEKAMADAGYTFDFEKKELKEIHVIDEDKAEMDYCFTKMMNDEKVCPSWNDYDEMMFRNTISLIETLEDINKAPDGLGDVKSWLKSLKERVQPQPKQEWGEEDSKRLQRIIDFLWYNRKGDTDTIYQQEQDIEWLKSLRPQTTWKPSGEQIDILDMVLTNESMDDNITRILRELREQLKKLREE